MHVYACSHDMHILYGCVHTRGTTTALDKKKRTIIEIRGEKNAVPRMISCSISAGQVQSATVRDVCPALIAPDLA